MNRVRPDYAEERRRWHLDKTISVGNLIAVVTLALPLVSYVITMDKRITLMEQALQMQQHAQDERDRRQDHDIERLKPGPALERT